MLIAQFLQNHRKSNQPHFNSPLIWWRLLSHPELRASLRQIGLLASAVTVDYWPA